MLQSEDVDIYKGNQKTDWALLDRRDICLSIYKPHLKWIYAECKNS